MKQKRCRNGYRRKGKRCLKYKRDEDFEEEYQDTSDDDNNYYLLLNSMIATNSMIGGIN